MNEELEAMREVIIQQKKIIEALRNGPSKQSRLPRLFHVTKAELVPSILNFGLRPDPKFRQGWLGTWRYVSNLACCWTATKGITVAILEVRVDPPCVTRTYCDPSYNQFYMDERYNFEGVVAKDRLRLIDSKYLEDGVAKYQAVKDSFTEFSFEFYPPLLRLDEPPLANPQCDEVAEDVVRSFQVEGYKQVVKIMERLAKRIKLT